MLVQSNADQVVMSKFECKSFKLLFVVQHTEVMQVLQTVYRS